jgi:hypothetical protein
MLLLLQCCILALAFYRLETKQQSPPPRVLEESLRSFDGHIMEERAFVRNHESQHCVVVDRVTVPGALREITLGES